MSTLFLREMIPDTFWTVHEELVLFGGACLLGIPAGLVCDCFRLLRRMLPHHPAAVAAEDISCLLLISLLLLVYASAFAKGVFRGYFAAGCLLGGIVWECTLGRAAVSLIERILRILMCPFRRLGNRFVLICKKVKRRFVEYSKKRRKAQKNTQKRLQPKPEKVYNNMRIRKKGKRYGKKDKRERK